MPTSPNNSLDQRRAAHAWKVIDGFAKQHVEVKGRAAVPDAKAKDFGTQAKKLPTRIMASGLGQALAFLYGKGYAEALQRALGDWILDKRANPESNKPPPPPERLIETIVGEDSWFLRRATDEALAYLQWLNRFAEARGFTERADSDV